MDTSSVDVTFDQCLFEANRYPGGVPFGLRQLGVINMRSSAGELHIENSVFRDNEFLTDFDVRSRFLGSTISTHVSFFQQFDTYLINVEAGNVLNMKHNCFSTNVLEGRGLVHLETKDSVGSINNNAGIGQDAKLTECDFVHVDGGSGDTCIGFDTTICSARAPGDSSGVLETGRGCATGSNCSSASTARGLGWFFITSVIIAFA